MRDEHVMFSIDHALNIVAYRARHSGGHGHGAGVGIAERVLGFPALLPRLFDSAKALGLPDKLREFAHQTLEPRARKRLAVLRLGGAVRFRRAPGDRRIDLAELPQTNRYRAG
jgi:hypothetical protein